jgi:hypothetical protein
MGEELDSLEESLLRHLLTYRGHQVRFEADAHTTEFGIYRSFTDLEAGVLKNALRQLENGRWIYRRVQYVIGFSEPKLVYSLTPNGYRKALDLFGAPSDTGVPTPTPPAATAPAGRALSAVPDPPLSSPNPPRKGPSRRHPDPSSTTE